MTTESIHHINTTWQTVLKSLWYVATLAVSPDSRQVAYLASESSGAGYIAVIPAVGGEAREIFRASPWLDGTTRFTLAWTPDQRYLLFVRASAGVNGPQSLWRVPVAGGPPEEMGLSMSEHIGAVYVHPDGRTLYFAANGKTPDEIWTLENFLPKSERAK